MFAIKHEFNKSVVGKAVLASSTCLLQAIAKETIAIEKMQSALKIISDEKLPALVLVLGAGHIKADGIVMIFSKLSEVSAVDTLYEGLQHFAEACILLTVGQILKHGVVIETFVEKICSQV